MSRVCIIARIDASLEKMRWQQMEVRAICLTDKDRALLDRALSARHKAETGRKRFFAHYLAYRDHQIRAAARSSIYSTHGVEVAIPNKLSPRVEALAA